MARLGVTKKKKSPRSTEISQLKKEVQRLTEQQTATSVLRVIAGSPTDLQPVLDVVAENAPEAFARQRTVLLQFEGDTLRLAASFGSLAAIADRRPLNRETPIGPSDS